jgi:hypothetical protein
MTEKYVKNFYFFKINYNEFNLKILYTEGSDMKRIYVIFFNFFIKFINLYVLYIYMINLCTYDTFSYLERKITCLASAWPKLHGPLVGHSSASARWPTLLRRPHTIRPPRPRMILLTCGFHLRFLRVGGGE